MKNAKQFKALPLLHQKWLLAASEGDVDTLKNLYQDNPELLGVTDIGGFNALHKAAWKDQPEVLSWLIEQGLDLEKKSRHDETAMFIAIRFHSLKVLKILVEKQADPGLSHYRNWDGWIYSIYTFSEVFKKKMFKSLRYEAWRKKYEDCLNAISPSVLACLELLERLPDSIKEKRWNKVYRELRGPQNQEIYTIFSMNLFFTPSYILNFFIEKGYTHKIMESFFYKGQEYKGIDGLNMYSYNDLHCPYDFLKKWKIMSSVVDVPESLKLNCINRLVLDHPFNESSKALGEELLKKGALLTSTNFTNIDFQPLLIAAQHSPKWLLWFDEKNVNFEFDVNGQSPLSAVSLYHPKFVDFVKNKVSIHHQKEAFLYLLNHDYHHIRSWINAKLPIHLPDGNWSNFLMEFSNIKNHDELQDYFLPYFKEYLESQTQKNDVKWVFMEFEKLGYLQFFKFNEKKQQSLAGHLNTLLSCTPTPELLEIIEKLLPFSWSIPSNWFLFLNQMNSDTLNKWSDLICFEKLTPVDKDKWITWLDFALKPEFKEWLEKKPFEIDNPFSMMQEMFIQSVSEEKMLLSLNVFLQKCGQKWIHQRTSFGLNLIHQSLEKNMLELALSLALLGVSLEDVDCSGKNPLEKVDFNVQALFLSRFEKIKLLKLEKTNSELKGLVLPKRI